MPKNPNSALLALDVGTTNWKAALFSLDGKLIGSNHTPTKTHRNNEGAYYDPAEMWSNTASITKSLIAEHPNTHIEAVAVTSVAESGVPIGTDGEPVYESIAWFDPRSVPQAERIEKLIGRDRFFAITGLDPNPIFTLFKLEWMRENLPEVYAKVDRWLWIADFINYRLCGEIATDFSLASRTMMLDIHKKGWSTEILDQLSVDHSILPNVVPSGTKLGRVTADAAGQTGIPVGTPVIVGGHDHHCGFLAAGALGQEMTFDSSGTVESIMRLLPKGSKAPTVSKDIRVGYFVDPERHATMAGVLGSGVSVDWAMRTIWMNGDLDSKISKDEYDRAMNAVAVIEPGSDVPFYLPHLRGAGAPYWNIHSRGAFVGLRSNHSRAELMRAVIEGLSLELRVLLTAVENAFESPPTSLITVGGGARNDVWQQIKADVTGVSVNISDVEDATAQGAALIAGVGVGIYADLVEASRSVFRIKKKFEPRRERNAYYDAIFDEYAMLYPSLDSVNRRLDSRYAQE